MSLIWRMIFIVIPSIVSAHSRYGDSGLPRDYCAGTSFNTSCLQDEVVIMKSAIYGRMDQRSHCIKDPRLESGCKTNVLMVADKKCSGRQKCEIRITDPDMDAHASADEGFTCSTDIKSYLSAAYMCEKAVIISKEQASASVKIEVFEHNGVIPSSIVTSTGAGSAAAPLILEAQPGQVINISMMDFNWYPSSRSTSHSIKYGKIIDLATDEMIEINGGRERQKFLYKTKGHRAQISLEEDVVKRASFIIKYEALGCPRLIAPRDAWITIQGTEMTVGCNRTRQTWHLTCVGVHWVGVIGNCTQQAVAAKLMPSTDGGMNIPHALAIFIVGAVSLIISCIIILIGVLFIKRYSSLNKPNYSGQGDMQNMYKTYDRAKKENPQNVPNPKIHRNDYMHIWDQPLPEPFLEEYQTPVLNDNTSYEGTDSNLLSRMKVIQSEMSRDLEKYAPPGSNERFPVRMNLMSEDLNRNDNKHLARIPVDQCENPECVRFVGYEPKTQRSHSVTQ